MKKPKYCNGRMKPWEFKLLHVLVIVNLILLIMIPVAYFSLIPQYVQYRIDKLATPGNEVRVHKMAIGQMTDNEVHFSGKFNIDALVPIPLLGGMKPFTINVVVQDKVLAQLEMPEASFWCNREISLDVVGKIMLNKENQENTQMLIAKLSSPEGIKDLKVTMAFAPDITAFGFTTYVGLPLKKVVVIGDAAATASALLSGLQSTSKNAPGLILVDPIDKKGVALREHFNVDDITRLPDAFGNFEMVWNSLDFLMDDPSAGISMSIAFENPTPLELLQIDSIEFFLQLEGVNVVKVTVSKFGLEPLLNKQFQLNNQLTFIDPAIDPKAVQSAFEAATKNLAENGNVHFAVSGPITISKAGFVSFVTKEMKVTATLKDFLPFIPRVILDIAKDPSKLSNDNSIATVKSILGESKISLAVLAEKIECAFGINLPMLDFIKLPKDITFPYQATVSIYGENIKAIQTDMLPINITRVEKGGINIQGGASVILTNTPEAAAGLANAINPIIAADPNPSSIGIKELAFFIPGQPHFKWCDVLFGERILILGLPPINKEMLIDFATSQVAVGVAKDISALVTGAVNFAQLNDRPGFGAKGNVKVSYPKGFPEIKVDLGFFHIDTTIESTNMASMELPTGLQFFPDASGTDINGAVVLSREVKLPSKIQKLADALLKDDALPSYTGVTGIRFGTSASQNFQTFSKIIFDIKTDTIIKTAKKLLPSSTSFSTELFGKIPSGLLKVEGVDFAINSPTDISLQIQSTLQNPFPVTLSVGSMDVTSLLDDHILVGVQVSPIKIGLSSSPLNLNINLKMATGENGVDQKVASLASAIVSKDFAVSIIAGITGLKMTPEGSTGGSAVIDQLSTVKVGFKTGPVLQILSTAPILESSPVDISSLIPKDILNDFKPQIKFIQADAQPNSRLVAGSDVDYINPLSISVKVPYFAISTSLDGMEMVDTEITSIQINRNSGTVQPRIVIGFKKANGLSDAVAKMTTNLLNGKLDSLIGIRGIYFGSSANSRNNLLAAINVDVTQFLKPFSGQGAKIGEMIGQFGTVQPLLEKRQEQNTSSLITLSGPFGIEANVNSVDVNFLPSSVIESAISASLGLPFPVDINIPYFSTSADIDDVNAVTLSSGLVAKGRTPQVNLNTRVAINDVEPLADKVSTIAAAFVSNQNSLSKVFGGRIRFGVSAEDNVELFSKVGVSLGLDKILALLKGSSSSINVNALVEKLAPKLNSIAIETKPAKTIFSAIDASFSNPLKVTIRGLNYFSASFGINGNDLVQLKAPGIVLSRGLNALKLATDMVFSSSENAKNAVADFATQIETFLNHNKQEPTAQFMISRAYFGNDEASSFKFLSRASIGIPSHLFINEKNLNLAIDLISKSNTISPDMIKPQSLDIEFTQSKTIESKVMANVTIPLALKLYMPFLKFGSIIENVPFIDLSLLGTQISGEGVNALSLGSSISINDSENLADVIAKITEAILKDPKNIPGSIGGGFLTFGIDNSPENSIDTFSKVALSIKTQIIADVAQKLLSKLNTTATDPIDLINKFEVSFKNIKAETIPNRSLQTSLTAGLKNAFPVSIKGLGYMTALSGIDGVPVASITVNGFGITPGANLIDLSTTFEFPKGSSDKVAQFTTNVQNVQKTGGELSELLFATRIVFGFSEETSFKFLSKAKMGIPSKIIVKKEFLDGILSRLPKIDVSEYLKTLFINKAHLSTAQSGELIVDTIVGLKNFTTAAEAKIGYFQTGTLLDEKS